MKICLQLAWKDFGKKDAKYVIKILKWIKAMNNTNKKIKVKLWYDLLWNKFVQKFLQTIQQLLNIPLSLGTDLN